MRILVLPRDPTPYQELLYEELRAGGVTVRYAGVLTPSHTVNLFLVPLELLWARGLGYRFLHLHWTFGFSFPGSRRFGFVRRLNRHWFSFVLRVAGAIGMRIVWTAHNVLPHAPVFDDDVEGRRQLIGRADLVIAHSEHTLSELAARGLEPSRGEIIRPGPMAAPGLFGVGPPRGRDQPRKVLFFGRVEEYKGVEELIEAVAGLARGPHVTVAGACNDRKLRERLQAAAGRPGVALSLDRVPEEQVAELIAAADALVYPFRRVTTSASLRVGLAAARPVIIPDLPALRDVPDAACVRYPPGRTGLAGALARLSAMSPEELTRRGQAARLASRSDSWTEVATQTRAAFTRIDGPSGRSARARPSSRRPRRRGGQRPRWPLRVGDSATRGPGAAADSSEAAR